MAWRASALAAALLAAPAAAQEGAVELLRETRAREAVPIPVRAFSPDGFQETVEGPATVVAQRLPDGTSLAAARAEEARRAAEGWETVLFCGAEACGGFDFRAALWLLPPPEMRVDVFDFHQLTMRRGAAMLSVLASRAGGAVHLQSVEIEPAAAAQAPATAPAADAPFPQTPAPVAPPAPDPAPDPAPVTPEALAAALDATGRAVLEGVVFDAGAAALAPGGEAALDAAAALLAARPDLVVAVVGHTDGMGPLDVNQRVSAARAQAVMSALVARGVAAARLSAAGAGWLAPRAANADEAGRARNRRVELVAR